MLKDFLPLPVTPLAFVIGAAVGISAVLPSPAAAATIITGYVQHCDRVPHTTDLGDVVAVIVGGQRFVTQLNTDGSFSVVVVQSIPYDLYVYSAGGSVWHQRVTHAGDQGTICVRKAGTP